VTLPSDIASMSKPRIDAVVTVGDGRGFVAEIDGDRLIVTAAHCLPFLPPAHPWSYLDERTYRALVGPLGSKPTITAECLFADPVADVAVLGPPDSQELSEHTDAYEAFVEAVTPLAIGNAPTMVLQREQITGGMYVEGKWTEALPIERWVPGEGEASALYLNGKWISGRVVRRRQWLQTGGDVFGGHRIEPGMSGSPIVMDDKAIALVSSDGKCPVLTDATRSFPAVDLRKRRKIFSPHLCRHAGSTHTRVEALVGNV
jgi:hypothetical protein